MSASSSRRGRAPGPRALPAVAARAGRAARAGWAVMPSWAAWAAVACSSPATLKVTVSSAEPGISAIRVEVRPPQGLASADYVDCTFARGRRSGPSCPFADSRREWQGCGAGGCDPLIFLLTGPDRAEVEVLARGQNDSGVTLTSTAVTGSLPSSGHETTLAVALPVGRFPSCSAKLDTARVSANETFVLPVPGPAGGFELLTIAAGFQALWSYAPAPGGCTLTRRLQQPTCALGQAPNGVLVGHVLGPTTLDVVALCSANGVSQINVAPLEATATRNLAHPAATLPLPASARYGAPILADFDGNGLLSVVFLSQDPGASDLSLQIWSPSGAGTSTVVALPGVANGVNTTSVQNSPMVRPIAGTGGGTAGAREGIIVSGFLNVSALYDKAGGLTTIRAASRNVRSDFAVSAATVGGEHVFIDRLVIRPTDATPRFESDVVGVADRATRRTTIPIGQVPPTGLPAARTIHAAIGDVAGDGTRTAVVGDGVQIELLPIPVTGTVAVGRMLPPLTDQPLIGGLTVLLANIDQRPGADIIAFNAGANLIFGVDHTGAPLPLFPITVPLSNAQLRVAIEDLDRDGSAELAVLEFDALNVFSLGPRSYDAATTPWPVVGGDARSTATSLSDADPLR